MDKKEVYVDSMTLHIHTYQNNLSDYIMTHKSIIKTLHNMNDDIILVAHPKIETLIDTLKNFINGYTTVCEMLQTSNRTGNDRRAIINNLKDKYVELNENIRKSYAKGDVLHMDTFNVKTCKEQLDYIVLIKDVILDILNPLFSIDIREDSEISFSYMAHDICGETCNCISSFFTSLITTMSPYIVLPDETNRKHINIYELLNGGGL